MMFYKNKEDNNVRFKWDSVVTDKLNINMLDFLCDKHGKHYK